jgi:hypothetical protein
LWWLKSRDLICGITPLTTKPLSSKGEIDSSLLDKDDQAFTPILKCKIFPLGYKRFIAETIIKKYFHAKEPSVKSPSSTQLKIIEIRGNMDLNFSTKVQLVLM